MLDIFKRPVVIIIVVVAIIIALIWSYYSKVSTQKKAAEEAVTQVSQLTDLSNIDPNDFSGLVQEEVNTAFAKAGAENSQNKLAAVDINLPSLELKSGETRYVFVADNDSQNNWTITFSESSGNYVRALIPKDDYLGSVQAMDTSLWKFNYVTALQIAEANGGQSWRTSNGLSGINITLRHGGSSNWLLWTVTYLSGKEQFIKVIDANSGKVVEE